MTAICYSIVTELQQNTSSCDESSLLLYWYRTVTEYIRLWWQQVFTVLIPNCSTFQVLVTAGCYFNDNELQQNTSGCDDISLLLYWYRSAAENIKLWWQQFVTVLIPNCSKTHQAVMTAVFFCIDTEMQQNNSSCDDNSLLLHWYRNTAEHIRLWWQQFVTVLIPNCNKHIRLWWQQVFTVLIPNCSTFQVLVTAGCYFNDNELQQNTSVCDGSSLLLYCKRPAEEHSRLWWQRFVTVLLPNCGRTHQVVMTAVSYSIDNELQQKVSGCDDNSWLLYRYRNAAEHIRLRWQQFLTLLITYYSRTHQAVMRALCYSIHTIMH